MTDLATGILAAALFYGVCDVIYELLFDLDAAVSSPSSCCTRELYTRGAPRFHVFMSLEPRSLCGRPGVYISGLFVLPAYRDLRLSPFTRDERNATVLLRKRLGSLVL